MSKRIATLLITVEYSSQLVRLCEHSVFRIVAISDKFYANGFGITYSDNIEVKLKNASQLDIRYLKDHPNHFCHIISKSKDNDLINIEITTASDISEITELNISSQIAPSTVEKFITKDIDNNDFALIILLEHQDEDVLNMVSVETKDFILPIKIEHNYDVKESQNEVFYTLSKNPNKVQNINQHFRLLIISGKIKVANAKKVPNRIANLVAIEKFRSNINNYLSLWDKYNSKECDSKFKKAREFNYARYSAIERFKGNIFKMYFAETEYCKVVKLPENTFLGIGSAKILGAVDSVVNTPNKQLEIEKEFLHGTKGDKCMVIGSISQKNNNERSLKIIIHDNEGINLIQKSLTFEGYVIVSLIGDMTVFNRRNSAKNTIWDGKCGIPNLFSFFGDEPIPSPAREPIEIDHSLIDFSLTANQEEALKIICNTPDFAIIQGPPGTGKTTLIELALNQICAKTQDSDKYANNLLCAFRHEAVINMAKGISIYGIPTIKVGLDNKNPNPPKLEEVVEKYINNLLNNLEEKYPDIDEKSQISTEFENKINNYINFCSSIDESKNILEYVFNQSFVYKNKDWCRSLKTIQDRLNSFSRKYDYINEEFLKLLYRLPLTKEACDDGFENFLFELDINAKRSNTINNDAQLLKQLYQAEEIPFDKIKYFRKKLILKYRPIPSLFVEKPIKQEIDNILLQIKNAYRVEILKKHNGVNSAIGSYINSLRENPLLVRQTLLEYSKVLGVTNQQTYSHYLSDALSSEKGAYFENVFIDEAATSSPLDLFLPMSLAKNRIVLVGDHKQLPNIVNEEIAESIESESKKTDVDIKRELKETLFEHLFSTCRDLEKKDGFRRVITLNTQFRMHPSIGAIVSKHFYKEEGGIISPRPASEFDHSFLGLTNQPFMWYHVPYTKNTERLGFRSSSRFNIDEADLIARKIKEAINRDDYNGESIGVITFYKPQVKELINAMHREGVFEDYSETVINDKGDSIKIEIGTVDAFQGKEFDIVFLSTVYSFDPKNYQYESYSRLTILNLLCVALSRAIKCLIVVGNKDIYKNDVAKNNVPSLCEILSICEVKGYVK